MPNRRKWLHVYLTPTEADIVYATLLASLPFEPVIRTSDSMRRVMRKIDKARVQDAKKERQHVRDQNGHRVPAS